MSSSRFPPRTALLLLAAAWPLHATDPAALTLYVSPRGNDQWSGRLNAPAADGHDGPLATLTAARDAIRRTRSTGGAAGPVNVTIREGTYHLAETLVLTAQDGGTAEAPVTYSAAPGEHPLLDGGRVIDGWKPSSGRIIKTHLPEVKAGTWRFRQLFFRGQRQTRARWPNVDPANPLYSGWAFVEAATEELRKDPQARARHTQPTFRFTADQAPRAWKHPDMAEMNVVPGFCWLNEITPLKAFDPRARTFTLARWPFSAVDEFNIIPGNRFYIENIHEELDQPGEWSLDTATGTLSFWPPVNVRPGDVIAPVIDTLIELHGTVEAPVRHVTISGLTFSHTQSTFPEQAPSNRAHAPLLRGGGVTLDHCTDCRIEKSRFLMLGGDGVRVQGLSARNTVLGNEIGHVGAAGVVLTSNHQESASDACSTDVQRAQKESARYPKLTANVISDNDIHHCGQIKIELGAGVHLSAINSVGTLISHNRIRHTSDQGVVMMDGFGRVTVEYNDMDYMGLQKADTGGINVNRWYPVKSDPDLAEGCLIRYNRIQHCIGCGAYSLKTEVSNPLGREIALMNAWPPKGEGDRVIANGRIWTPYYAWGIYFDNSGTGNIVHGNIVVSTVLGGITMAVGVPRNNRVENNIFIGSSGNQMDLRIHGKSNHFTRNIVYYADSHAALLASGKSTVPADLECDSNVYYLASKEEPQVRGIGSFSEWQKLGFDQHSVLADPLFVDVKNGDYRLRPGSPAFALGFQPIPMDQFGPRVVPATPGSSRSTR